MRVAAAVIASMMMGSTARAEDPPPMVAGGLAVIGESGFDGQLESRYARPLAPRLWWSSTAALGLPLVADPGGSELHGDWMVEGRTGLLARVCNAAVCAGVSAAVGAQHRRVTFEPAMEFSEQWPYQTRRTAAVGDGRVHAQLNWAGGRAGFELQFGIRAHYRLAESFDRQPAALGPSTDLHLAVVAGAGIVGSL